MGKELLFFSADLLEFLPGASGSASAPLAPWSKHQAVRQESLLSEQNKHLLLAASVHVEILWDWWGFRGTHLAASPHLLSLCSINQMTCFLQGAFKIANWPLSERGFQLGLIFSFYKKEQCSTPALKKWNNPGFYHLFRWNQESFLYGTDVGGNHPEDSVHRVTAPWVYNTGWPVLTSLLAPLPWRGFMLVFALSIPCCMLPVPPDLSGCLCHSGVPSLHLLPSEWWVALFCVLICKYKHINDSWK